MPPKRIFGRVIIDSADAEKATVGNPLYVTGLLTDEVGRKVVSVSGQSLHNDAAWRTAWSLTASFDYTYPSNSGEAIKLKSGDAADTSKRVRVVGLDANFDIVTETITTDATNGTTAVTLVNTYSRICFVDVLDTCAGTIALYDSTITNAYAIIAATRTSTRGVQAVYTIPDGYTGYLLEWGCKLDPGAGSTPLMGPHARLFGEAGRFALDLNYATTTERRFRTGDKRGVELPAKTDIEMRGYGAVGVTESAWSQMTIAIVPN